MKEIKSTGILLMLISLFSGLPGCKNRDINERDQLRPREIRDNFDESHFTRIVVDDIEYLIMERDNNNPHEGFGFMAFRANKLMEKQDTVLAYLRTLKDLQVKTYAALTGRSVEEVDLEAQELFNRYLTREEPELIRLEQTELKGKTIMEPSQPD